ncbi:MAG TPA: hypothetical protein VGO16_13895 [Pseudonocardiaceae bacterium]|nr:hypothetical protein [Pseudonocardiaceae bacterium]
MPGHPNPTIPGNILPMFARMGMLAGQLAEDAATALDHRDALSGDRLAEADDEADVLRCRLFSLLFAEDGEHGVEAAVDVSLIGRYTSASPTMPSPSPGRSATRPPGACW